MTPKELVMQTALERIKAVGCVVGREDRTCLAFHDRGQAPPTDNAEWCAACIAALALRASGRPLTFLLIEATIAVPEDSPDGT